MSLQIKVGTFNQRSGTGTQAITGAGFQAAGAIVWGNSIGGVYTRSGPSDWRIGLSDGVTNLSYAANSGNFFNAVEASESAFSFTQCFMAVSTGAGPGVNAAIISYGIIQSFDADGFTANFQFNLNGLCNGHTWNYILIGGLGISVKVNSLNYAGASGSGTVTGLSFVPTTLIGYRSSAISGPINGTNTFPNFGVCSACNLAQYAMVGRVRDSRNPSVDFSGQKSGIWSATIDDSGNISGVTSVTAFTSDGFSYSYTNAAQLSQHYMAIGGCASNVGSITQPLVTGLQSTDISAQSPKAIIIAGFNKPTSSVGVVDQLLSLGASDLSNQVAAWTGSLNGQPPNFKANKTIDTSHIITAQTPTGDGSSTLNTTGLLTTLGPTNIEINWQVVDGIAREWFYLVFADNLGTGACGVPESTTGSGIYQQVLNKRHDTIYV